MLVGVDGFAVTTVIALHDGVLFPHELEAYTQIFPLTAVLPKLMLTEVVPCPEEMDAPVGAVQVYDDAPLTNGTEYKLPVVFLQTIDGPEGVAGADGDVPAVMVMTFDVVIQPELETMQS